MKAGARRVLGSLLCVALTVGGAAQVSGSDRYHPLPGFEVPVQFWTDPDFHPVGYLSAHPGGGPAAKLSREEKLGLSRLFRAAGYAARFKYRQGYPLSTTIPIYRLLRDLHPRLAEREGEGGAILMTDAIVKFLEGPEAMDGKE